MVSGQVGLNGQNALDLVVEEFVLRQDNVIIHCKCRMFNKHLCLDKLFYFLKDGVTMGVIVKAIKKILKYAIQR